MFQYSRGSTVLAISLCTENGIDIEEVGTKGYFLQVLFIKAFLLVVLPRRLGL